MKLSLFLIIGDVMKEKRNIFKTNNKRFVYSNKMGDTYSIWAKDEEWAYKRLKEYNPERWRDYILFEYQDTRQVFR